MVSLFRFETEIKRKKKRTVRNRTERIKSRLGVGREVRRLEEKKATIGDRRRKKGIPTGGHSAFLIVDKPEPTPWPHRNVSRDLLALPSLSHIYEFVY